MQVTHVQAHLAAHALTLKHAADDPDKLTKALVEARVDLNPHQVDAALFAFQNPLSQGAILADEVGLGKTIEAGLVATQHWAEGRRRVLVLCTYNPDWAVGWDDGEHERVHLVRETKGTHDGLARRGTENTKIACAKRHFEALGADYAVATSFDDLLAQVTR